MPEDKLYNTQTILDLLRLEAMGGDRYVGQSHYMGSSTVFGGQVLGQALHAAMSTVEGRKPHSMHALFLLPGNHALPIEYEVERVRDGGSFSTRRIVAWQEGRRIFVMSCSFQKPEQGLEHQRAVSLIGDPETLPSLLPIWKSLQTQATRPYEPVPVDFRSEYAGDTLSSQTGTKGRRIWVKAPVPLPDDEQVHQALFTYVSDYRLLATSLLQHGLTVGDPRLQMASLDHSIWLHRPFRMDEWLLFETDSPNASGGRGLCQSFVYNLRGELVASIAQEGLIRLKQPR